MNINTNNQKTKVQLSDIFITPPVVVEPKSLTHVVILNDRSGSMHSLRNTVTDETNKKIKELHEAAAKYPKSKTICTIFDFSDTIRKAADTDDVNMVKYSQVISGGGTKLNYSLSFCIDYCQGIEKHYHTYSDIGHIILAMTDGEDTAGQSDLYLALEKMKDATKRGNITVAVLGPKSSVKWAEALGISAGNVLVWDGETQDSYTRSMQQQTVGLGSYFNARSSNIAAVSNFYTVDPDKVKSTEFDSLPLIPKTEFEILNVSKGGFVGAKQLAPFVRENGFKFKQGAFYYELVKPENITPDKDIVLYNEQTGELRGGGGQGKAVRRFLGLPDDKKVLVHPSYGTTTATKVFVQSNSNNRRLIAWNSKKTGELIGQRLVVLK